jgi:hypothetical protein
VGLANRAKPRNASAPRECAVRLPSEFGVGQDQSWVETNNGRAMPVKGVKGRYVRFWSNGRNIDDMNQYIEAEVYGK